MEKTLVIIKPDAIMKKLAGRIQSIYEDNRLDIINAHRCLATKEVLENHYSEHHGKYFYNDLIDFMSSSEIMVLVLSGNDVVNIVREINGATNPSEARPGTIRYMYGESIQRNAVHGSGSIEDAKREIDIWREFL